MTAAPAPSTRRAEAAAAGPPWRDQELLLMSEVVRAVHRIRRRRRRLLADDVALLRIIATFAGQLLQLRSLVEEKTRALEARNAVLTRALESAAACCGIIGISPALLRALGELERVSQAAAAVLLLGESGTGTGTGTGTALKIGQSLSG